MSGLTDLLLLGDGRAPVGAYAHSFGLESAVVAGEVSDVASLTRFVWARLVTTGAIDASFAAVSCRRTRTGPATDWHPTDNGASPRTPTWLVEADGEYDARIAAPPLREASRALGRHLLRLARRTWPARQLEALAGTPAGWHHPLVLGVLAASRGLTDTEAATLALYGLGSGVASAGVRLLGLDPIEVHAMQARLADDQHEVARRAAADAHRPFAALPDTGTPLLDIRAIHHAGDPNGRLFAS